MPRIITYCLKPNASNSDDYHHVISAVADSWLSVSIPQVADLIHGFGQYRRERGETDRSDAEYAFELLTLGVLLREHGHEAALLPGWAARLLAWLVDIQNRQPRLEKAIKRLRGWFAWVV